MELIVIRHALPVRIENAEGPADPPLSPTGHDQSARLASWLAAEPIAALYTSPLTRARETAAPVAATLGMEARVADGISEYDRHSDTYVPIEELKAANDPRWQEMAQGGYFDLEGIDPRDFQRGVVAAFEEIIAAHPGETVAAVCHGGVINAWSGHVLGIADFMFMHPDYTSISRYRCSSGGHRSVHTLNETPHLRAR